VEDFSSALNPLWLVIAIMALPALRAVRSVFFLSGRENPIVGLPYVADYLS